MIITLSADADPQLTDLDRFDRLHAVCEGAVGAMRMGDLCRAHDDGEHVWLDVAAARSAGAAASDDPAFGEQYDAMIAFAAKHGWLDEAGTHVRAHIEAAS